MSKRKILFAVFTTLITALVFFLCLYFSGNAQAQLPSITQMNYNLKSDDLPLTIKDIENLSQRISFKQVSFCTELEQVNVKEESVTPVLTNEFYFEIYGQALNGSGITKENIENKDKVAVISSNLALKLFFNTDAVGKTVTLNDEVYTICGVIQENDNIINRLSGDGKQRIYIPYTCYSGYDSCDVNTISYDNSASSAPLIEQMNLSQYHSINFSEKAKVIKSFEHIIFLILFIALCFIALKIWYRICKKLIETIKENLRDNYFLKSIKTIPLKYILLIITALGIPAVLLSIFLISDFSIFIIPRYIPYDNIFDVSDYISAVVENLNIINSLALTGDNFLINLYSASYNLLFWLLVMFALCFTAFLVIVNNILNRIILSVKNRG